MMADRDWHRGPNELEQSWDKDRTRWECAGCGTVTWFGPAGGTVSECAEGCEEAKKEDPLERDVVIRQYVLEWEKPYSEVFRTGGAA